MKKLTSCLLLLFGLCPALFAQNISGFVLNEQNEPIPFVNIFVQELQNGTSADTEGRYFLALNPGNYHFVISAIGYETKRLNLKIGDEGMNRNIILKASDKELDEITVKAKKRDPAFEIIQKVIENKKAYLSQLTSAKSEVYIKATEEIEVKEKEAKKKKEEVVSLEGGALDPFEEEKKEAAKFQRLNMTEMQLTLNYQAPNKYKEERSAVKKYGDQNGLYIPRFSEADFNFYRNMVDLRGISNNPIISPISRTAIVSYKYRLVATLKENGREVYKIKVIPRKTGNYTVSGYLYINEGLWNINRLDLSIPKGSLKFYDKFSIDQTYRQVSDSLWIPTRQEFTYRTKQGKAKTFKGNTVLKYDDFQPNYTFPPKFFGVEVAITKQEAYDRDSSYWNSTRPEPLTKEQMKMVLYRDSVEIAQKDPAYLDSLDKVFNKIKLGEVLFHGVGFRNNQKKRQLYIGSMMELINFEVIGGFRLGPYLSYFKRWESGRFINGFGSSSIGLRNGDVQGSGSVAFRYNPFKLGDIFVRGGRIFQSINSFDAYLNQLRANNYILNNRFGIGHRIELFNGFYIYTGFDWRDRRSVENFNTTSILNQVIDAVEPLSFDPYQAFITETYISFTPKQRYMREPNRKVVLGSVFPTFELIHRKGWNNVFSSDIDFDYLGAQVKQNLTMGVLGNGKYTFEVGKFFNDADLRLVDIRRFRQSDPILYSDPLNSFQLLDTALTATDWFYDAHYIHHFNGALINNIPLIKKTRINVVAGGGAMWIKESNFRHEEVFAGVERVFKLGARRRLRLGVYGVAANSNQSKPTTGFKISFDIIDTWKRDWSY